MTTITRKLPIGIQTFEKLRTANYLYVDKTALVYNLASLSTPFFLNRPRRFGRSLLFSTLNAYFSGRKDLFEGLAIEKLETEWTKYPVLHLNLGLGWYSSVEDLYSRLDKCLQPYEELYGIKPAKLAPDRFYSLIRHACQQTGKRVVVLIDEYDKPLLAALHNEKLETEYENILRGFYGVLKEADQYLRFVLIAGVTNFTRTAVFSDLNQVRDISMDEQYATICGITKEELIDTFTPELERLAERRKISLEQTIERMAKSYGGSRFCENTPELFSLFSILNAFSNNTFGHYWFQTATPSYLVRMLDRTNYDLLSPIEGIQLSRSELFYQYSVDLDNPIPALYQSGYLTIKDYDRKSRLYTLGFPNDEVRHGFWDSLLPYCKKRSKW